jgi:hypothetical protein
MTSIKPGLAAYRDEYGTAAEARAPVPYSRGLPVRPALLAQLRLTRLRRLPLCRDVASRFPPTRRGGRPKRGGVGLQHQEAGLDTRRPDHSVQWQSL